MSEPEQSFVILLDESAAWKVAGLRQVDRLTLALKEIVGPQVRLHFVSQDDFSESSIPSPANDRVLSTRLLVDRQGFREFLRTVPPVRLSEGDPTFQQARQQLASQPDGPGWKILRQERDLHGAERFLVRRAGKPQDGIVSRFINRPLTRPATYLLLKLPVTPTAVTLILCALPLASLVFLLRGDYSSVLIGCALYQLYSMLDGCDGEIARAKYLESTRGGQLDSLCDVVGFFVFIIGLGIGLSRVSAAHPYLYLMEGFFSAAFIAAHECLLRVSHKKNDSSRLNDALYPRHREVIEQSGILFLGEGLIRWIVQLTKRDVTILGFLILALLDRTPWILHYSVIAAAIGLGLSLKTRFQKRS